MNDGLKPYSHNGTNSHQNTAKSGVSCSRKRIRVYGIVQGVGFRPFVYRHAHQHHLSGWVCNDAKGVVIEIEGDITQVDSFVSSLIECSPPQSRVERIDTEEIAPESTCDFQILESNRSEGNDSICETSISPDLAFCDDCLREMLDPSDRRFRYPFINCTNCGPRFSIVCGIPYDRPYTTMARFEMCADCRREYEDPLDRRYHAQPIACPVCGPRVWLSHSDGRELECSDPVLHCAALLRDGKIAAIKGLGGFHLACDATSETSVRLLRERKHRPRRPLAVMASDLEAIRQLAEIGKEEEDLLSGVERPIVLLKKREDSPLADGVAPGLDEMGVMLPYTPLHVLLCQHAEIPLVMTSGNLSDEPLCIENDEALERLKGIADVFLMHDRDIARPCDDSVMRMWRGQAQFIRRSRGYAPTELRLPEVLKEEGNKAGEDRSISILAVGGDLKNTCCLTKRDIAVPSQHLGDLELVVSQEHAERSRRDLATLLAVHPNVIVSDRHPGYVSKRLADEAERELGPPPGMSEEIVRIEVQHHHAHLAACLAEHGRDEPAFGLTWDGTGYGDDGAIWGGETLLGDLAGYQRVGCLESIPLVGGDRAVKETWRVGLAWLQKAFSSDYEALSAKFFKVVPNERLQMVDEALKRGIQSVPCCSMGRLFDAVASLAGIADYAGYEGEAAIGLEQAAKRSNPVQPYEITLGGCGDVLQWELGSLITDIVNDRLAQRSPYEIARAFHETLVRYACESISYLTERWGKHPVALSGGCFQNRLLLDGLVTSLEGEGYEVLVHRKIPCNDGGIAFGQAAIAFRRLRDQKTADQDKG